MPAMIEIKDKHIREAELLLINGNEFDKEERRPFIKNLETLDLLAVPGSGKTTALQAKLYCLAKHMPFSNGSGILVLSHTNKAVEEIEKLLKPHCPQLFKYPNFVGTVHRFINTFLANSACFYHYGSHIHENSDDIYKKEIAFFYNTLPWRPQGSAEKYLKNELYGKANRGYTDLTTEQKNQNAIKFIANLHLNTDCSKIIYGDKNTTLYTKTGNARERFDQILSKREELFSKGILSFRDSYFFADKHIATIPCIKQLLRSRFHYVFLDEAQDLEKHQLDIIDNLFLGEGNSSIVQRIGDRNQSIYSSGRRVNSECAWIPRTNHTTLNKSYRLSNPIARVVDYFTLDKSVGEDGQPKFVVTGNDTDINIPPHLIIYNDATKEQLKEKFRSLIEEYSLHQNSNNTKRGFKIIGWNGDWKGEDPKGKLRLENIFPNDYAKSKTPNSEQLSSLCDCVIHYSDEKSLKRYQHNIVKGFCKTLNLAGKKHETSRRGESINVYYNPNNFWVSIRAKLDHQELIFLKSKIYKWSFNVATNNDLAEVYNEIKAYIETDFASLYEFDITREVLAFLPEQHTVIAVHNASIDTEEPNNINIDVCSVHSVKGQTHCATMYVETFYRNYETKKLKVIKKRATKKRPEELFNNPLFQQAHNYLDSKSAIETLKMMYVGFSRPTHLLCFAALKDNISADDIVTIEGLGWDKTDLTI